MVKDSDNGHAFTIPAGTMLAAGGYYVADVASGPGGFGLGAGDSARLFAPADLVTPIDSYSWASHAAATYGRCPDGTGPMTSTSSSTRGAANDCPVAALAWPGERRDLDRRRRQRVRRQPQRPRLPAVRLGAPRACCGRCATARPRSTG